MNDADFMRYSRQILLNEFPAGAQEKLAASQVLIIGLGGLGSPAALYLAGAGVGTLILADDDTVHISNLQRQILFCQRDIHQFKTSAAHRRLSALNENCKIIELTARLKGQRLDYAISQASLILDCSDNMATRQEINASCVQHGKPLISASATGFKGQMLALSPPWTQGCYRCLWPDIAEPAQSCRNAGVLGPVVGIMGTLQALTAIKLLAGMALPLGQLTLFDGLRQRWQDIVLTRTPECPVCGGLHASVA